MTIGPKLPLPKIKSPEQVQLEVDNYIRKLEFDFFIKNGRLPNDNDEFTEEELKEHDKAMAELLGFKI